MARRRDRLAYLPLQAPLYAHSTPAAVHHTSPLSALACGCQVERRPAQSLPHRGAFLFGRPRPRRAPQQRGQPATDVRPHADTRTPHCHTPHSICMPEGRPHSPRRLPPFIRSLHPASLVGVHIAIDIGGKCRQPTAVTCSFQQPERPSVCIHRPPAVGRQPRQPKLAAGGGDRCRREERAAAAMATTVAASRANDEVLSRALNTLHFKQASPRRWRWRGALTRPDACMLGSLGMLHA